MIYGYARVSRQEQTLEPQLLKLKQHGCDEIITDYAVSGAKFERDGLDDVINKLQQGDSIVVVKLDRLGRSLKHLIETLDVINAKGANFVSLTEGMDTNTSTGRLLFNIFGAIAEFERDLIRERTLAGLESARANGRLLGRRKKLNPNQIELAKSLKADGHTVSYICDILRITPRTFYNYCYGEVPTFTKGRPKKLDPIKIAQAKQLRQDGQTIASICHQLGISTRSYYNNCV